MLLILYTSVNPRDFGCVKLPSTFRQSGKITENTLFFFYIILSFLTIFSHFFKTIYIYIFVSSRKTPHLRDDRRLREQCNDRDLTTVHHKNGVVTVREDGAFLVLPDAEGGKG